MITEEIEVELNAVSVFLMDVWTFTVKKYDLNIVRCLWMSHREASG